MKATNNGTAGKRTPTLLGAKDERILTMMMLIIILKEINADFLTQIDNIHK
jgi:hypothetical protein